MSESALSATASRRANARLNFAIVAETDDYLVVDKPPYLLVHPTKPTGEPTLWSGVRDLLAFEIANGGQVSIVNRLDRETSGLVLIAKTAAAARLFGRLMQEHRIAKEYLAIVWGWPTWESFTVDRPLVRQGLHGVSKIWLKQTIDDRGAVARTDLRVGKRLQFADSPHQRFSIVRATPHTGRTHQIRVHLASTGHPIVGDKIYGPDETAYLRFIESGWTAALEELLILPRHALHSAVLAVDGIGTWKSEPPADLKVWLNGLTEI